MRLQADHAIACAATEVRCKLADGADAGGDAIQQMPDFRIAEGSAFFLPMTACIRTLPTNRARLLAMR
jgi:hypothetical protein